MTDIATISGVDSVAEKVASCPICGAGDLALLTRQLATLVESNLPIDEALQAAAEQSRSGRSKGMLLQVRSRVAEGHTLAYALSLSLSLHIH